MKIALSASSLKRRFSSEQNRVQLTDLAGVVRQEFGLDAIEVPSAFFPSRDRHYLAELLGTARRESVHVFSLAIENQGDLGDPDRTKRQQAVENHASWLLAAKRLEAHSISINTGGDAAMDNPDVMLWCTDSVIELVERAARLGVFVLVENGAGVSANAENIIKILDSVNSPWAGTLADFGRFPRASAQYDDLEMLLRFARVVRAPMTAFDERGSDPAVDIPLCVEIARSSKFDGFAVIQFDGDGDDHEGVLRGKDLLERSVRGEIKTVRPRDNLGTTQRISGLKGINRSVIKAKVAEKARWFLNELGFGEDDEEDQ